MHFLLDGCEITLSPQTAWLSHLTSGQSNLNSWNWFDSATRARACNEAHAVTPPSGAGSILSVSHSPP